MTGIETAAMISSIMSGSLILATPPCARMSAGTRSSAITATAPASSAIFACSASTTSMITPPLSISARPLLTLIVPTSCIGSMLAGEEALDGTDEGPGLLEECEVAGVVEDHDLRAGNPRSDRYGRGGAADRVGGAGDYKRRRADR